MSLRGLLPLLVDRPEFRRLRDALARESAAPLLTGVTESAKPYVVAALAVALDRPVLYVVRDNAEMERASEAVAGIVGRDFPVLPYADRDALPYERLLPDAASVKSRMNVLAAFSRPAGAMVVICSDRALAQPVMPPEEFAQALVELQPGMQLDPRILLAHLLSLGYANEPEVEETGQVSHRGGIVDVFPPALTRPLRIEFFGDEIESIRTFDPETQRSLNDATTVLVGPAREALALHGPEAARRLERLDPIGLHFDARERWERDLENLRNSQSFDDIAFYLPYLHHPSDLLAYLPESGVVVLHDQDALMRTVRELAEQGEEVRDRLERDGENPPGLLPAFLGRDAVSRALGARKQIQFAALVADETIDPNDHEHRLSPDLVAPQSYGGRMRAFAQDVRKLLSERQRVVVVSGQARRLSEVFGDEALLGHNNTVMISPATDLAAAPDPGTLAVIHGRFPEGWHSRSMALSVFTDAEIFGWSKRRGEQRRATATPASFLAELRPSDFIVHQDHGIGRFEGLVKLASTGVEREYLLIQYAGTDKLYIPTDQLDRITRYIGMGDAAPALSKLGGSEWARAKQRAKESAQDIARDLLRLYTVRELAVGHPFPSDEEQPWLQELEESFAFEETPDQQHAIEDVKRDMERARPMDRLVCGDVGYGKTEVALRAAFKAVLDQRQVVVLVPTTILALQHFNTFTERLKPYPLRIELLSRFRSEKELREVVEDIKRGKVDIVVGTHRLLSKDVEFNNLGLLIIDEEQRFGVAHKERLKQLRTEVDVLTLTATPIPRTLHMALVNVRDMSVIETPPAERLPIRTYIRHWEDALVREAILREVDRGGQVFFVHNRVQGIQALTERLRRLVPEATFAVAHGQMHEDQLEKVMLDFASGAFQVLVSTTIIENGLDISNANTIIVNNAAFFGLAQLYQLRGRVGRGNHQAYAYFLYNKDTKLTPVAEKRLRAIFEATELGAGFRIAMKDLEIRGAGNLLGAEQSGFANTVGFDLYTRLLGDAILEMRGEMAEEQPKAAAVSIELPVDAFIPDDYINDRTLKMSFYQRLANFTLPEQVEALAAEMTDRFGTPPEPVANLLALVRLKTEAAQLGFESVAARDGEVIMKMRRGVNADRVALYKKYRNDFSASLGEVRLARRHFAAEPAMWLQQLRDLLPVMLGKKPPEHGAEAAPAATPAVAAHGARPTPQGNGRAAASSAPQPTWAPARRPSPGNSARPPTRFGPPPKDHG